jgi:hypothetical protein
MQSKERIAAMRRWKNGGFYIATGDGENHKESERSFLHTVTVPHRLKMRGAGLRNYKS